MGGLIWLLKAVEESLKSVKLFDGGIAEKQAGKYSGGMKRRLSVAISLIGDPKVGLGAPSAEATLIFYFGYVIPRSCNLLHSFFCKFLYLKVVYMDEPSTGLDPSSRNHLWNVIKTAKQDRAIILTSSLSPPLSHTIYLLPY